MHKYFKNKNFIKINFLLIIAIVFCTCNLIFAIDFDAHNEYVINVRSKRIHSLDCASAKRISEYNKIIIIATLSDLESVDDYDKAGDDCTKYIFSCLNYIDNSFTSNFNLYTGFVWRRITTHILATDRRKLLYGLSKLGFDVYDAVPELVDLDNDGHKDFVINKLD